MITAVDTNELLDDAVVRLGVRIVPLDDEIAYLAGTKWLEYRQPDGPRERFISDFLIGAHAEFRADRFPTRDRGFYKSYFPQLRRMT